ncbi:tautomerase [Halobium salinum]|uniref:Tautomerase n=1 Tax=Halobium salinum TaxID=1364940 RepID=A0ABD5PF33_9EURY|nr:tautomerase [Halobium salinum]
MPLLQFDTSVAMTAGEKRSFANEVTELYTELFETTSEDVVVSIRAREDAELHLGRAEPGPILLLDAHVRRGRPTDRRREFARAVMDAAKARWKVPEPNMTVTFTEHDGDEMMGYDRVGGEWEPENED